MNTKSTTLEVVRIVTLIPGIVIMMIVGNSFHEAVRPTMILTTLAYSLTFWFVVIFTITIWKFAS